MKKLLYMIILLITVGCHPSSTGNQTSNKGKVQRQPTSNKGKGQGQPASNQGQPASNQGKAQGQPASNQGQPASTTQGQPASNQGQPASNQGKAQGQPQPQPQQQQQLEIGTFSPQLSSSSSKTDKVLTVKIITSQGEDTYIQKVKNPHLISKIQYSYLLIAKDSSEAIVNLIDTSLPLKEWKAERDYSNPPPHLSYVQSNSTKVISMSSITEPLESHTVKFDFSNLQNPTYTLSGSQYPLRRANVSHIDFDKWKSISDDDLGQMSKFLKAISSDSSHHIEKDKEYYLALFQLVYKTENSQTLVRVDLINSSKLANISYTTID